MLYNYFFELNLEILIELSKIKKKEVMLKYNELNQSIEDEKFNIVRAIVESEMKEKLICEETLTFIQNCSEYVIEGSKLGKEVIIIDDEKDIDFRY